MATKASVAPKTPTMPAARATVHLREPQNDVLLPVEVQHGRPGRRSSFRPDVAACWKGKRAAGNGLSHLLHIASIGLGAYT